MRGEAEIRARIAELDGCVEEVRASAAAGEYRLLPLLPDYLSRREALRWVLGSSEVVKDG